MSKQCNYIAQVVNPTTNQEEDSKLFLHLLSLSKVGQDPAANRKNLVNLYKRCISEDLRDRIVPNNQGQYDIGDLIRETDLANFLDSEKLQKAVDKEVKSQWVPDTDANYQSLSEKIINFNDNSDFKGAYVAELETRITKNGTEIRSVPKKFLSQNRIKAENFKKAYTLNTKLRTILQNAGVKIGALTKLEQELGVEGVTDFDTVKKASNGIVELIRLAKGSKGEVALPEEFSHFVLECLKNETLAQRLLTLIDNYNLAPTILGEEYDEYSELYESDNSRLIFEAASKLIMHQIFLNEGIIDGAAFNLTERLKNVFKQRFSNMSEEEIETAIREIESAVEKISKSAFVNPEALSFYKIQSDKAFYRLDDDKRLQRDKTIVQNILDTEVKRFHLYGNRYEQESKNGKKSFSEEEKEFVSKIANEANSKLAILKFVERAQKDLKIAQRNLSQGSNERFMQMTFKDKCAYLRNISTYVSSYKSLLGYISNAAMEEESYGDDFYGNESTGVSIKGIVQDALLTANYVEQLYNQYAGPLFLEFFKPLLGDNIVVPFGKNKGKEISIEQLMNESVADISFLDRWLNSMANSGDWINKLFDRAVKQRKTKARLEAEDYKTKLLALGKYAEQNGITNFDWLYEQDNEGNLTLNFVSELNWGQYRKDKSKFYEDLDKELTEKYGDKSGWKEKGVWKERNDKRDKWLASHREWDKSAKHFVPIKKLYFNPEYSAIQKDDVKKHIYDEITGMKAGFDSWLPNNSTQAHTVPVILRDLVERVKNSQNLKDGAMAIWESLRDEVIKRSDNTDYGVIEGDDIYNGEGVVKKRFNFIGHPVDSLPIYYQRLRDDVVKNGKVIQRGDSANDVSTDIISTMTAYADMACNYKAMHEVIDALEICRDYIDNQEQHYYLTEGGKPVIEQINELGRKVENRAFKKDPNTRLSKSQRDDFFSAQVYGRYFKDAGTISILGQTFDLGQLANLANKLTSLNGLAINFLAGIANVDQGSIMMDVEAKAKQFFTTKDVLAADKQYAKWLPECMSEIGARVQTGWLNLFSTKFNVLQEYDRTIKDINFNRRNWFVRMFGSDFLYFTNNSGEHWMQHRTFFALANSDNEQLELDGDNISLLDAYERKYVQQDGSLGDTDAGLGAKLIMKTGILDKTGRRIITREEIAKGHKITDSSKEISEDEFINYFSRKCSEINHRMHGIYNTEDMNAFQRTAIGRMAMIFRKWMIPSFNRRFRKADYNLDLEDWTEGYYRTAGHFMTEAIKAIRSAELAEYMSNLSDYEKQNLRRAATEMAWLTGIVVALLLIDWGDDDKNRPWAVKLLEYKLLRMRTEIGAMAPTPLILNEFGKLVQSPLPAINTWENLLGCWHLLFDINGWSTDEEHAIQSGRFKGHSKNYRTLMKSPLMWWDNDLYHITHPEELIPFYKQ